MRKKDRNVMPAGKWRRSAGGKCISVVLPVCRTCAAYVPQYVRKMRFPTTVTTVKYKSLGECWKQCCDKKN